MKTPAEVWDEGYVAGRAAAGDPGWQALADVLYERPENPEEQ